jgi:pilus assembly protein Flp/PilA
MLDFLGMGRIQMMSIKNFINDESGASAAEYALILAIAGGAILAGVTALSGSIQDAMTAAGERITGSTDAGAEKE